MIKSKEKSNLNLKNPMLLIIVIQTESFVQNSTEILSFNILFTVVDGIQLLLHGIWELGNQFKMFMDHSLVEMVSQIVEWIFWLLHGDKMINYSNGNQENANSMKLLIGMELKYQTFHAFCMHANLAKRTKTW